MVHKKKVWWQSKFISLRLYPGYKEAALLKKGRTDGLSLIIDKLKNEIIFRLQIDIRHPL